MEKKCCVGCRIAGVCGREYGGKTPPCTRKSKEAQNSTCNQQTKVLISALKFGYHAREDGASLESTINQYKSLQKQ